MKDKKRVRKILSQHLGLELAREVLTKIEDTEREIGEAGHLRDYTEEDGNVTLEELMGEKSGEEHREVG
jgi:hypothetical protein